MAFTDTAGSSHNDPDDISLFLRQLVHRSSSSSSSTPIIPPSTFPSVGTHARDQHQHLTCFSSLPITTSRTPHHQIPNLSTFFSGCRSSDDTLNHVVMMAPEARFPVSRETNLNSSESYTGSAPVRSLENEYGEDYDCESEEGGAAEEEADLRLPSSSRNQSKRSRAAEVHNLSEKRRRSRINEKMKALQNLIPNSNKTDKASMLDEAIEYLKQLQLQVQMLSMRNGLSLHPLCVPQIGLDYVNKARSVDANMPNELDMLSTRPSLPDSVSSVMNSEVSSYGLEDSYTHDNFGPFHIRNYPQAVCRGQNEQLAPSNAQTEIGVVTTTPFDTRNMDVRSLQNYGIQKMLP